MAALSQRLRKEPNYAEDYAFTYIDSDLYTRASINRNDIVVPSADYVDIGYTIPTAVYKNAENTQQSDPRARRFMEWVTPQAPGHVVLPGPTLNECPSAQRMIGRIGLYNCYDIIYHELNSKINRFSEIQADENHRRDVDIWVVASSCGGTGSAMILDVLYMINRIGHSIAHGEPDVKLVLYMPQAFVDANCTNANHKLNAYACLSEINFFRSNYEEGKPLTFEPFAARPLPAGLDSIDFPLYRYMIPVCTENNFGSKMKMEQFYPTVANMIYYLNDGGTPELVNGLLSNVLEEVRQTRLPGITNQMVGYGYRAIKKANKELKEYLTRRALYEVVQYGLLDKTEPANFDQLKKEFAQTAILKYLFTIVDTIREIDHEYQFDNIVDSQSVEAFVKRQLDGVIRYDPSLINVDGVRQLSQLLENIFNGESFNQTKQDIYILITQQIDNALNTFIHEYGLHHAFTLLNHVDDFYLEPLYNYISTALLPEAMKRVMTAKMVCSDFVGKNWVSQKMTKKSDLHQYIQKYKEAVARAITLRLSMEIIRDLCKQSTGYLEKLRKGDNLNFAGIRDLQRLLEGKNSDFANEYANLAEEFRATAADIMTVYIPSLAEIATGENNADWAPNNIFDQLYQQSILEQEEIEIGDEKKWVPVRKSETNKGLTDILELLDPDNNLFIKIIKDNLMNIGTNCERKIIAGITHVVETLVNEENTPASDWISIQLSEAIHYRNLIPEAFEKNPWKLFDSFRDAQRVPVFFPLKDGVQMPMNMRLMFVGKNKEFAQQLGYDETNTNVVFIEDPQMEDRFLVLRMPAGLSFDMYKYYPAYKAFHDSERIQEGIRNHQYGCYIHRAFNEHGVEYFRTHSLDEE